MCRTSRVFVWRGSDGPLTIIDIMCVRYNVQIVSTNSCGLRFRPTTIAFFIYTRVRSDANACTMFSTKNDKSLFIIYYYSVRKRSRLARRAWRVTRMRVVETDKKTLVSFGVLSFITRPSYVWEAVRALLRCIQRVRLINVSVLKTLTDIYI